MLVWYKTRHGRFLVLVFKNPHVEVCRLTVSIVYNVSFVPLCTVSLSLLEGGANGIDDTATQFAEVRADLRDFG